MEKTVQWVSGYPAKIKPDVALEELERIRAEHDGKLTAEIVANEAKPKTNPLHDQVYDLSVREAAQEHYLANARKLVRSLVVTYVEGPKEPTRVFTVVEERKAKTAPSGVVCVYGSTEEALQDPEHRNYVLMTAMREAAAWCRKYAALSELAKIFRVIEETGEALLKERAE